MTKRSFFAYEPNVTVPAIGAVAGETNVAERLDRGGHDVGVGAGVLALPGGSWPGVVGGALPEPPNTR